jgi:DNA polymerase-3 subunit gamma/tau
MRYVDGANDRSVEFVRNEILPYIRSTPVGADYKIMIIDEIHNYKKDAMGPFLVLLEKMPARSIIIFCTTEGDKIPPEIKNRCFSLRFNSLDPEIVGKRIARIFNENDHRPFTLLAKEANGSFRQAWAFVDVWQNTGVKLDVDNVYRIVGAVPKTERAKLWFALSTNDIRTVQTLWKTWIGHGAVPTKVGTHLIEDLMDIAASRPTDGFWMKPLAVLSGARLINSYDAWLPAIVSIAGYNYSIAEVKEVVDMKEDLGIYLYG